MRAWSISIAAAAVGLGVAVGPAAASDGESLEELLQGVTEPYDPFVNINRKIYELNETIYSFTLDPAFDLYHAHVPLSLRQGLANFFSNLRNPFSIANSALAGEWELSKYYLNRFVVNSTFGLLGVLDVAHEIGMPRRDAFTVGDLLCSYDVPAGPYVVLPIIGPGNLRTTAGRVADVVTATVVTGDFYQAYLGGVYLHKYEDLREEQRAIGAQAIDPYAVARSVVEQKEATCGLTP
jgi:phospholipid-binding lipoprotein MlaA